MPDFKQALKDFVATSNSGKYKNDTELLSKFPEFKGLDAQVLKDYVATTNSGKYKTEDEVLAKFPEFNSYVGKQEPKPKQNVNNPFNSKSQEEFIGKENATRIKKEVASSKGILNNLNKLPSPKLSGKQTIERDLANKRIQKIEDKGTDVKNTLGASLNDLYAGITKTPRYVYDLFSVPQNFIAEQFNIPEVATNYDNFLKLTDRASAGLGQIRSPLSALDGLGDFYEGSAQSFKDKQIKYEKGIFDSLKEGDLSNAGSQLVNQIVGSAPSIALMAGTSGVGSVAKLGGVSKTLLNALPFASSKSNEIRDDSEIPEYLKPLISAGYGLSEVVFDQKFGTQAIINRITEKFKKEGVEVALDEGKKFATGYLTKALKGIKEPLSDLGKNALEGMTTRFSQNLIDKIAVKPDKDLTEGLIDAVLAGGAMGAGISGLGVLVNTKSKANIAEKTKAIQELTADLDTDIPEDTKQTLLSQVGKLKREVNTEITKADEQFEALDETSKEKAIELSAKIDGIEKSLTVVGITPTTKITLEEQKVKLEEQLAEIKPIEATAPTETKQLEYFNVYEDAVKQSPTKEEAFAKATESGQLSDTFNKKYNPDGSLTPEQTFEKFYNEIKPLEETQNDGKADSPTKENINERLNINHPFYKKVSDALSKLGIIQKYNPETGEGDVVGGYSQPTSDGGFSVGGFIFTKDGSISFLKDGIRVEFDKNGNVISENTSEVKIQQQKAEIDGIRDSIESLEKRRDSDDFKYKTVNERDALGNIKKVKRLKTPQELKESTDKINAQIDKNKSELSDLEKSSPTPTLTPTQETVQVKPIEETQNISFEKAISDEGVFYLNGEKGNLVLDGQTLVFETNDTIREIGNVDELSKQDISEFGIEKEVPLNIQIAEDNSVVIDGIIYKNNYSKVDSAINYDKDGNVVSINLETENGSKRTIRGQKAEEIAYQYKLKEFEQNATDEQINRAIEQVTEVIRTESEVNPTVAKTKVKNIKPTTHPTEVTTLKASEGVSEGVNEGVKITPEKLVTENKPLIEAVKSEPVLETSVTAKVEETGKVEPLDLEQQALRQRASVKRVMQSNEYSDAFKESLSDETVNYRELPNAITEKEAQAMIDVAGEAETIKQLYDFNNGIKSSVRFTVMQKLIDNYEAIGEYAKAGELAQELYSKGTDYGQGIQIFSTFPKLSRQSQISIAEKNAKVQRDEKATKAKPTTDKLTKAFKTANKEAAQETVEKVVPKIDKALNKKSKTTETPPKNYGASNKIVTKDKYKEALKNLRKKSFAFAGAVPLGDLAIIARYHLEASSRDFALFSKRMVADVGSKIKPYLKDLYVEQRDKVIKEGVDSNQFLNDAELTAQIGEIDGTAWKAKLDKAIAKKDTKAQDLAIQKLQEISKDEGLWGRYRDSAVSRLKGIVKTNIQSGISESPSLEIFTNDLVRNMRAKMNELLPETPKKKSVPRPDIEVIGDAYKNFEKYKDVWEKTQEQFREKYADNPEILESLDGYFGEILDKPFNDKSMQKAISKGLKDMGKNIGDLIVQHYTVLDSTKQTLAEKLVNEAGLEGAEAEALSKAVQQEFDKIATQKKQQALEKVFSKRERRKPAIKTLEGEIIKMSNLGAFKNETIIDMYGDKMGWVKLTEENKQEIGRLTDIVQQTADPLRKRRAIEDLLAYQALLQGNTGLDLITSIWYANVLSGYKTQQVNIVANIKNTGLLYSNAILQRPKDGVFITKGLLTGLKRGFLEARETLTTGYSPIKGAPEVPTLLEIKQFLGGFKNPLSYLKYVRRVMIAADVVFFEAQKEMRAYQLAKRQASRESKLSPSINEMNRAIELIGRSDGQIERISEKVELEHEERLQEISTSNLTAREKSKLVNEANRDKSRKVYEYVEQERTTDLVEQTSQYAAEGTYNYKPQGTLGVMANYINEIAKNLPPLRYVVPFTNIIANVANETINYTPIGFYRRARANSGGAILSPFRRVPLNDQQKADLTTKAVIGTTLTVGALLLSTVGVGDDDKPWIEITANGTGEYSKNQALQETGWQQYSIRIKKGINGEYGSWISYQYSPLILTLGFVGHYNDAKKYKDTSEQSLQTQLSKATALSVSSFYSTTYLTGLSDFMSKVADPNVSGTMIESTLKGSFNAIKGVVVPNLATQILQNAFDSRKEVKGTIMGSALQDIPYARNMYADKINIIGEEVKYDNDKFISQTKKDPIIDLLVEKKAVFEPLSRRTEKIYDIELGKERILDDNEFYLMSKIRGQFIKKELEKWQKMTPEQLKDARLPSIEKSSSTDFKKQLTKIKNKATKEARNTVVGYDGSLFEIKVEAEDRDITYKLTPEQVKQRLGMIEEYKNSQVAKKDLTDYTTLYKQDGFSDIEAKKKAVLSVQKDAFKESQYMILEKVDKGIIQLTEKP